MRGVLLLAILMGGCGVAHADKYLKPYAIGAVLYFNDGSKLKVSEILYVDENRLWVLESEKMRSIPLKDIDRVEIYTKVYGNPWLFWVIYTPVMMFAPLMCPYTCVAGLIGMPFQLLIGCSGCALDSRSFEKTVILDLDKNWERLRIYCRYPQGMPTYFYVKGDSLYVFSPLRGELTYEVYSEDGDMIASAEVGRVYPGLNSFALIEKGEVRVYLNGGRVRELPVPPEESEHIPPYSRYKLEFKKDALTIRVFEGSVWVRYRILTEDGKPVRERELGLLGKGTHLYRLELLELEYGTYILEVRVGDEVKKYRVKVEER